VRLHPFTPAMNPVGRSPCHPAEADGRAPIADALRDAGMTPRQLHRLAFGDRDPHEATVGRAVESFGRSMEGLYARRWDPEFDMIRVPARRPPRRPAQVQPTRGGLTLGPTSRTPAW